jgi:hypothetical protein
MPQPLISRRAVLASALAIGALPVFPVLAAGPVIQVAKDPDCGCCLAWVAILEEAGFAVSVTEMPIADLAAHKIASGVPAALASCHTGTVDGYVLEGHVPVAEIRRLLVERPDALGLSVPGMPIGSPGMGPETSREAYDVHLILRDGTSRIYASYAAA